MQSRSHKCWGWFVSFSLRPLYFQLPPVCSHLLTLVPPSVADFSTLKIEAICSSETSVHRRKNLKSYKSNVCLFACLPDYYMMLFHFPGLVVNFAHFTIPGGGGWFWIVYLRGRRMVVAYLRQSNRVTEEQRWKPESDWQLIAIAVLTGWQDLHELNRPRQHPTHLLAALPRMWPLTGTARENVADPHKGLHPSGSYFSHQFTFICGPAFSVFRPTSATRPVITSCWVLLERPVVA
jgi:hypothetical protein